MYLPIRKITFTQLPLYNRRPLIRKRVPTQHRFANTSPNKPFQGLQVWIFGLEAGPPKAHGITLHDALPNEFSMNAANIAGHKTHRENHRSGWDA